MAMNTSYTIDKVGWHTNKPGNNEPFSLTHTRFQSIIAFLQENGLTTNLILKSGEAINDETSIHTDSLTEDGRLIMKKCYHKWLTKIEKGLDPLDISLFQKELSSMRLK